MHTTPTPSATILVVDDDALINLNTVDVIAALGHAVLEAYSGREALDILAGERPVDALITDYSMPGMTGLELAAAARELRPGLPVLLTSGYTQLPDGITTDLPILTKPYREADLLCQLARLLGAGATPA